MASRKSEALENGDCGERKKKTSIWSVDAGGNWGIGTSMVVGN